MGREEESSGGKKGGLNPGKFLKTFSPLGGVSRMNRVRGRGFFYLFPSFSVFQDLEIKYPRLTLLHQICPQPSLPLKINYQFPLHFPAVGIAVIDTSGGSSSTNLSASFPPSSPSASSSIFGDLTDSVTLSGADLLSASDRRSGAARAVFASYRGLHRLLDSGDVNVRSDGARRYSYAINSRIISASLERPGHRGASPLLEPVQIRLRHLRPLEDGEESVCAFWDRGEGGGWSDAGCARVASASNEQDTECRCQHLTHFALLVKKEVRSEEDVLLVKTPGGDSSSSSSSVSAASSPSSTSSSSSSFWLAKALCYSAAVLVAVLMAALLYRVSGKKYIFARNSPHFHGPQLRCRISSHFVHGEVVTVANSPPSQCLFALGGNQGNLMARGGNKAEDGFSRESRDRWRGKRKRKSPPPPPPFPFSNPRKGGFCGFFLKPNFKRRGEEPSNFFWCRLLELSFLPFFSVG